MIKVRGKRRAALGLGRDGAGPGEAEAEALGPGGEDELGLGEREVASRQVGELVMEELRHLDEVAYVRFASVYRSFRDADEFMKTYGSSKPAETAKVADFGIASVADARGCTSWSPGQTCATFCSGGALSAKNVVRAWSILSLSPTLA